MTHTAPRPRTASTLTPEEEVDAAKAVEAGVLAAAVLADRSRPDVPDADLVALVTIGREGLDRIVTAHAWLVGFVVAQEFRGVGSRDDLRQQAWLALAEAVHRYDHRRGRFSSYAMPFVRAGVRTAIARDQGLSERQSRGRRLIRRTEGVLAQSLGRLPEPHELAHAMGCDQEWVRWCDTQGRAVSHEILEEIPDPVEATAVVDTAGHWRGISEAVRSLSRQERSVVSGRFPRQGEPVPYAELAAQLGVSVSTIRRLERAALARLRALLATDGMVA